MGLDIALVETGLGKLFPRRCGNSEAKVPHIVDVRGGADIEAVVDIPNNAEPSAGDIHQDLASARRWQPGHDDIINQTRYERRGCRRSAIALFSSSSVCTS